jgi:PEP-CTERM motif
MKKTLIMLASLAAFAGIASASVTYTVAGAYTSGGSGQLLTASGSGDTFTLVWSITAGAANNTVFTFPSNENFGEFTLSCTVLCDGADVTIPAFTFVITIDDTTDGGIGIFTGSSAGGIVTDNGTAGSSNVSVSWSPLQIGPGTNNLTGGTTFGPTFFTIGNPTPIVDPTTDAGIQTISGVVGSTATPEPATFGLMGAALVGLGFFARKRKS